MVNGQLGSRPQYESSTDANQSRPFTITPESRSSTDANQARPFIIAPKSVSDPVYIIYKIKVIIEIFFD